MKLLKKEFRLCLHPTGILMLFLSALILIPNYPYAVSFFYVTLSLFFICLSSRENHDLAFTASLPVSRGEMVKGRVLMACCLEGLDLLLCGGMVALKSLMGYTPNQAGMDANLALIGEGLLVFGLFNLIFFPAWYKNVNKVGVPFLLASGAVFLYITAAIIATYALPFVRDRLDTQDFLFLPEKLGFLGLSLVLFIAATLGGTALAIRRFERLDLTL